jgi:hypothetical protein
MLFGILFTGLQTVSMAFLKRGKRGHSDLGWLANFQADSLPLIRIVLFDRIKESLTLSEHQKLGILCSRQTHLVFRKLCIVHVLGLISYCQYICQNKTSYLIPVLLDTTLCSLGERLPLHSVSHSCATPTSNITRVYLTFAISAQLFPASRIVLSLCSSAGVQGVFVRLFFAGGPIDGELMLGSS